MTIIRPNRPAPIGAEAVPDSHGLNLFRACLLYTSDAADE